MGPKLLGGAASLLAAAFVLALPSVFKGEPANEVEPIRLGPPPVAKLAQAVRVIDPEPAPPPPATAIPTPTPLLTTGGGGDAGGRAAAGTQGEAAQGPGNDVRPGGDESKSQGGTGAGNGNNAEEDEDADLDVGGDDGVMGDRDDEVSEGAAGDDVGGDGDDEEGDD